MNFVTQAEVVDIIEHNDVLREYVLELDKERRYNPGSFVQLSLELVSASDIWPDSRTFSIASYEIGKMRFIIKNVGAYTSRIFNELKVGNRCSIKYPFGDLFDKNLVNEKKLFIAGGVGITPYLSLIKYYELNEQLDQVFLFYSAKYFNELLHYEELKEVLGENMDLFITREVKGGCHFNRINIDDIQRVADKNTNVFVCGSKQFNFDYKKMLMENGYSKIYMDEWE